MGTLVGRGAREPMDTGAENRGDLIAQEGRGAKPISSRQDAKDAKDI
jgi:hypothetical protein